MRLCGAGSLRAEYIQWRAACDCECIQLRSRCVLNEFSTYGLISPIQYCPSSLRMYVSSGPNQRCTHISTIRHASSRVPEGSHATLEVSSAQSMLDVVAIDTFHKGGIDSVKPRKSQSSNDQLVLCASFRFLNLALRRICIRSAAPAGHNASDCLPISPVCLKHGKQWQTLS